MTYLRVIPRDFFNESKLLKCLGQFQLCVFDNRANGLKFSTELEAGYFQIEQYDSSGALYCANYRVFLDGDELLLSIPYNSKEAYPLMGSYRGEEYYIFDENGKFMPNFGFNLEVKNG